MQVPVYKSPTVQENALPVPQQNPNLPSGAFGENIGKALGDVSTVLQKVQEEANNQVNQVVINSAKNDYVGLRMRKTFDPQEGYLARKGKAALDPDADGQSLADSYYQQMKDASSQIADRLGNAAQKHAFSMFVNNDLTQFRGDIEKHTLTEYHNFALSTQADTGATLFNMGEKLQRTAMSDLPDAIGQWDTMVDLLGPAAGWDAVKQATAKQTFNEVAHYNSANATLEGAAQTGDIGLIRDARAKIEGPDGEPIDPAKRTLLITKAYAYENGVLAADARAREKADREQQARENEAVTQYNAASDLMSKGRYFSQDYINELATKTAGTKMAKPVQELFKSQAAVAGFASLSLPQQQAQIERMVAAGSDRTIGVDPMNQKVQEQYQHINDESKRAYAENPWKAAQERAVITDAPVAILNNVRDAQQILGERMKSIAVVEVAAGRKISPLQPQEAEQIGRMVRSLPPDQQSAALASFGSMVGDADRLTAMAKQIDDKDKVLGTAMMYANLQTTQGRYVSELILRGDRAIRDKAIMIDSAKETGWRGAIAKEIGDAFPNQEVRNKMIDAAYYIQAGFAAEGSGTDTSRAVRMAAGRIVERNNNKFPLPYGMEESDFNKRISSIKPEDLAAQAPGGTVFIGKTGIPVSEFVKQLPDAALVHAGQGRYNVRAGTGLVTNAQGRRITIMVK